MRRSIDSGEAAELHRELFTVLAHDLGGIATALSLRADAVAAAIPAADHSALQKLAEQVRDVSHFLRIMRGAVGATTLAPSRRMTIDQWYRFASRLTSSILPKGVRVDASFRSAELSVDHAGALAYIWMAGCKDLASRGLQPGTLITLRNTAGHGFPVDVALEAAASGGEWLGPKRSRAPSRWEQFAARLAASERLSLAWWKLGDDGIARWRCALGSDESAQTATEE